MLHKINSCLKKALFKQCVLKMIKSYLFGYFKEKRFIKPIFGAKSNHSKRYFHIFLKHGGLLHFVTPHHEDGIITGMIIPIKHKH